jgi:hypothetical protein
VEVALRRDGEAQSHTFGPGAMFVIDEGVFHDFRFTEDTLLVGLYSRGVETGDGKMDHHPGGRINIFKSGSFYKECS